MNAENINLLCKRCPKLTNMGGPYDYDGYYCAETPLSFVTSRIESSYFVVPLTCQYYMEMVIEGEKVAKV